MVLDVGGHCDRHRCAVVGAGRQLCGDRAVSLATERPLDRPVGDVADAGGDQLWRKTGVMRCENNRLVGADDHHFQAMVTHQGVVKLLGQTLQVIL